MKKIKFDKEIDVKVIEADIIEMFPQINKQVKDLSMQFSEKILIYLELVRRGQISNLYKYHRDKKKKNVSWKKVMTEQEIEWVQVCQRIRRVLLSTPRDSPYSIGIKNYLLSTFLKEREHDSKKNGAVPRYMKGLCCQSYKFINHPESYQVYELSNTGSDLLEKIEKILSKNKELSDEQNEVREYIINNTGKIKLENNHSSRGILHNFFHHPNRKHPIRIKPTEFIQEFNSINICRTDDFGFRLNSKVSLLKNGLFKWLRYNGEPLHQLDIACSQPFILSAISSQLIERLIKDDDKLDFLRKVIPTIQKYEQNDDYILFRRLCYKGLIYEYLMNHYRIICKESISRDRLKRLFFYNVFSDISTHPHIKETVGDEESKEKINIVKVFKQCFPSVYSALSEIQKVDLGLPRLNDKNGNQEKYKNTSLMLQRVESAIVYSYVAPMLYRLKIFFTTKHDSLILLEKDITVALALFKVAFLQLGMVVPTITDK